MLKIASASEAEPQTPMGELTTHSVSLVVVVRYFLPSAIAAVRLTPNALGIPPLRLSSKSPNKSLALLPIK